MKRLADGLGAGAHAADEGGGRPGGDGLFLRACAEDAGHRKRRRQQGG